MADNFKADDISRMDCNHQLLCLEKVIPVTNPRDLMHLSYSDIRRIAAARAKVRLYERMKQQEKTIPRGKLALNSTSVNSLLPTLHNRHIKLVNSTWEDIIKYTDFHGVRIIDRLAKKTGLIRLVPKLATCKRCQSCRSLKDNATAKQYGRSLIMHITDVVTNLRNNETLRFYLKEKFQLLREAGFEKEDIQACQEELILYLADIQPSKWSSEANTAWKTMSGAMMTLVVNKVLDEPVVSIQKVESTSTVLT